MTSTAAAMALKAPVHQGSILHDDIQPGLPAYSEFATTTTLQDRQINHNLPPDYEEDQHVPVPQSPSTPRSSTTSDSHRDSTTSSNSIIDEKAALAAHYSRQDSAPPSASTPPSSNDFIQTNYLQIQHAGKSWLSLPLPTRPEPIPIYAVDTKTGTLDAQPVYLSIRPNRRSGSSFLVRANEWEEYGNIHDYGDEYKQQSRQNQPTGSKGEGLGGVKQLTTTTYKFGPGNPPVVSLLLPSSNITTSNVVSQATKSSAGEKTSSSSIIQSGDIGICEEELSSFAIQSKGLTTRAVEFESNAFLPDASQEVDVFTWRYASSTERKSMVPHGANSILVLERRCRALTYLGGKRDKKDNSKGEPCQQIARLIRNDEFRSPGSSASTAGNGGRLVLDLKSFGEEEEKREKVQQMVVTTALIMLKREVDRRRAAQIAIMGGAGGN